MFATKWKEIILRHYAKEVSDMMQLEFVASAYRLVTEVIGVNKNDAVLTDSFKKKWALRPFPEERHPLHRLRARPTGPLFSIIPWTVSAGSASPCDSK